MAVILGIIKIYSDDEFPRFLFGVFWNDVEKKNRSEVVKVHDFF